MHTESEEGNCWRVVSALGEGGGGGRHNVLSECEGQPLRASRARWAAVSRLWSTEAEEHSPV